jgi:hypothetical protein
VTLTIATLLLSGEAAAVSGQVNEVRMPTPSAALHWPVSEQALPVLPLGPCRPWLAIAASCILALYRSRDQHRPRQARRSGLLEEVVLRQERLEREGQRMRTSRCSPAAEKRKKLSPS